MCGKKVCPYKHPIIWFRQKWIQLKFKWMALAHDVRVFKSNFFKNGAAK